LNQYENEIQKHENVVYEVNASEEILVFIENVATFQTRIIVYNVMYDEKHDLKDNDKDTQIGVKVIMGRHFVFVDPFIMGQIDRYKPAQVNHDDNHIPRDDLCQWI
jgi:hypothetical protein